MKLKNLVKLPEKRRPEEDPEQQGSPEDTANYEYNQAIDQIGEIEVELDVGKIYKFLSNNASVGHTFLDTYLSEGEMKFLAQAIADNFKEIVK